MSYFKKRTLSIMLSFLLIFTTSNAAFANTISSNRSATVNGYTYTFSSETVLDTVTGDWTIAGKCNLIANTNVPIGYMGAQARLYTESGALYLSSAMTYNRAAVAGNNVYTSVVDVQGSYYTKALCKFYNGDGYSSYDAFSSPVATLASANSMTNPMLISEYQTNSQGKTYGSDLSSYTIGQSPELISAIGIDGTEGYVRAADLDPAYTTIEDAINHDNTSYLIPLYDSEENVIGSFLLETILY